ncbi:MAG: chemotaxis response regulator protein-glutamate methylesterase [Pseudomonadota bacterium]
MEKGKKIRVLVVDDSAFMRRMLSEIIDSDPGCEVIKTARDGVDALRLIEKLRPDVVTLDIELPEIDGVTCLVYIMKEFPTPVVMVSGLSSFQGEETLKCLEYGAIGFIAKPKGPISMGVEKIGRDLMREIKIAAQANMARLASQGERRERKQERAAAPGAGGSIVAIAASTGGPRALSRLIPELPADLPAGVLIAQHMPHEFIKPFAERLNRESRIEVKVAQDEEIIRHGKVLIAPTDHSIIVARKNGRGQAIILSHAPGGDEDSRFRAADRLMASLAPVYGGKATGVVLTGMGDDGTAGLRAIKENGGRTMAEDESSAIIFGMPGSAIKAGVVDKIVPLEKMADAIVRAVKETKTGAAE